MNPELLAENYRMKVSINRQTMKKGIITLISIGILLGMWQLFSLFARLPDLVPSVPRLLETLTELFASATLYQSVAATVLRGIAGMLLSLIAAAGVAFMFSRHELLYELFRPILAIMRSIPVISFILLALIFLNPDNIPLMIAFLTMFPLLAENLTNGIRNQRKELLLMAQTFRISRWNRITQIVYPQLKPFLYSGLASASGFGWRAIIMGEVLAQCSWGIGSEMKRAQTFIAVPELLAWTVVAILISFVFDKGISWVGRKQIPIHYYIGHPKQASAAVRGSDIRLTDICYSYGGNPVLSHFGYSFKQGTIYGITAPSGTGKTTLLNLINGTLQPDRGTIDLLHHDRIATVFQEPELLNQLTVAENIALPLAAFMDKASALQQASVVLNEMELHTFGERFPTELSFGQQQRVSIARALAYPASLLLMDEPFKGLDETLCHQVIERIRNRQAHTRQTILFTSHNPAELHLLAEEVIRLDSLH